MSELRWILLGCGVLLLGGIFLWGRRSRGQAAHSSDPAPQVRRELAPQHGNGATSNDSATAHEAAAPVANRWGEEEWTDTVADLPEIRMDSGQPFDSPMVETTADEDELLLPIDDGVATEPNLDDPLAARHATREAPAAKPATAPAREPARTAPKATDKRKIIALRLSAIAPERYPGARLRTALESLGLRHGRYGIFHRLDANGASIVSVASMVEPGAFDLATMADAPFAGITLFAMLPGPLPGQAMCDQIFDCAQQLGAILGGALHDERGAPLTNERIAAIRDEVLDFEHLLGTGAQHA
jgi:cell division protein ZipA